VTTGLSESNAGQGEDLTDDYIQRSQSIKKTRSIFPDPGKLLACL